MDFDFITTTINIWHARLAQKKFQNIRLDLQAASAIHSPALCAISNWLRPLARFCFGRASWPGEVLP
jgi:hypothetical protein